MMQQWLSGLFKVDLHSLLIVLNTNIIMQIPVYLEENWEIRTCTVGIKSRVNVLPEMEIQEDVIYSYKN